MKKELKKQFWGWGMRVDKDGNLHDVFPTAREQRDTEPMKKKRTPWHVHRKPRTKLVLVKP